MPIANNDVKFKYGSKSSYEGSTPDGSTIYFITDTKEIIVDNVVYTSGLDVEHNTAKLSNYGDSEKVPKIVSVEQTTGNSTDKVMSQDAITTKLSEKQSESKLKRIQESEGTLGVLNSDEFTDIFVYTGGVDFQTGFTGKQIKTFYCDKGVVLKSSSGVVENINIDFDQIAINTADGYTTTTKIYLVGYTSETIPLFTKLIPIPVPTPENENKVIKVDNAGNYVLGDVEQVNADWNSTSGKSQILNKPTIPTQTSQLTNNSGFITDTVNNLTNYYKKSETYTQTEINNLVGAVASIHFEVVTELPSTGENNYIYLKASASGGTGNIYDEYIYVNNNWELIGSTQADLSNYYNKSETDTKLSEKQDKHKYLRIENETKTVTVAEGYTDIFVYSNATINFESSDVLNNLKTLFIAPGCTIGTSTGITAINIDLEQHNLPHTTPQSIFLVGFTSDSMPMFTADTNVMPKFVELNSSNTTYSPTANDTNIYIKAASGGTSLSLSLMSQTKVIDSFIIDGSANAIQIFGAPAPALSHLRIDGELIDIGSAGYSLSGMYAVVGKENATTLILQKIGKTGGTEVTVGGVVQTTWNADTKLDKTAVKQEAGQSETDVLSQKAASDLYMLKNNGTGTGTTILDSLEVHDVLTATGNIFYKRNGHRIFLVQATADSGAEAIFGTNSGTGVGLSVKMTNNIPSEIYIKTDKIKFINLGTYITDYPFYFNNSNIDIQNGNLVVNSSAGFVCEGTTQVPETPPTDTSIASKKYVDTKVSKTGNETISGVKTFTDGIKTNGVTANVNNSPVKIAGPVIELETRQTNGETVTTKLIVAGSENPSTTPHSVHSWENGTMNLGTPEYKFKDGYFSGSLNGELPFAEIQRYSKLLRVDNNNTPINLTSDEWTDIFAYQGKLIFKNGFTGKQIKSFYMNKDFILENDGGVVTKINVDFTEKTLPYTAENKMHLVGYTQSGDNTICPLFHALLPPPKSFTITLTTTWTGNEQVVSNANFLTGDYVYSVMPQGDPTAYTNSQIYADDVTIEGQMKFHCTTPLSAQVTVNILRQGVE